MMHAGPWLTSASPDLPPAALVSILRSYTMNAVDLRSGLVVAALALLLITASPEEFRIPECVDTVAAAGLAGPHRWGLILPNSSRLSVLTYKAIVAVRYPKLVTHTDCKP